MSLLLILLFTCIFFLSFFVCLCAFFFLRWIYESAADAAQAYANANSCSSTPRAVATPFDGGPDNLACTEHPDCAGEASVLTCMYDGEHLPPSGHLAERLTVWFLGLDSTSRKPNMGVDVADA
jgi:hypothetical protein